MKTLFIYFNRYIRPRTQLSLSLLETIVKNEGHETKIFDTSFYKEFIDSSEIYMLESGIHKPVKNLSIRLKGTNPYEDFKKVVLDFEPELVAFSFYTLDMDIHQAILRPFKKDFPHIKVICGGPTPCVDPEFCFGGGFVDAVCCGEGENVLKEVCYRIDNRIDLKNIKGLWLKEGGEIIKNGVSDLTDLTTLPVQNWDSYDPIHIYGLFEGRAYRMGHVESTRGCPFDCSYCGSGSIKKAYTGQKYVRHKNAEQFVDECEKLKNKYNLEMFYFVVGTFTVLPKPILRKVAKLYNERVGLPFIALVHPSTIDKETAELLEYMGCIHTSMGVESGDQEFRKRVFNRNMTNDKIINSITELRNHNIHVSAYNIIGVPGMDRKHVFKTIALNKVARPHSSLVSVLIPFPDAQITKNLIRDGLLKEEDIVIGSGLFPTIKIKEMTHEEITGLFNTFNLYVKFPKIFYPIIKLLEKDNAVSNIVRKIAYRFLTIERAYYLLVLRQKIKRRKRK